STVAQKLLIVGKRNARFHGHSIKHLAGPIRGGDWARRGMLIDQCHCKSKTATCCQPGWKSHPTIVIKASPDPDALVLNKQHTGRQKPSSLSHQFPNPCKFSK